MIDAWKRRIVVATGLGVVGACLSATTAAAAPLRPHTVATAAGRALLLDQTGRRIALPRAGASPPSGATPTYLAHRLPGRSGVPEGTPTVAAAAGRGAVGPLRLDALAIQTLNADLAKSSQAAVIAPRQAFLVEKATDSSLADATAAAQYWRAAIANQDGGNSVGDTMKGWFDSGTDAVKKLNTSILDTLKKTFAAPAPKPVIAAQVIDLGGLRMPPADESSAAAPQAAPVPEPSTWLVFAAASVLGLRLRSRKAA